MKAILLLLAVCPFLPGCIAWELRDELHTANGQLCDTNTMLVHMAQQLTDVDQKIQKTNDQLADLDPKIQKTNDQLTVLRGALGQAEQKIASVDARLGKSLPDATAAEGDPTLMGMLGDVHTSLKEVLAALGPLGKSLGMVSSAASWFGMGGDEADLLAQEDAAPADQGAAAAAGAAPHGEGGAAAPAGAEGAPAASSAKRPDMLVGTWMLVYPPVSQQQKAKVFIVSADGKYIESESGKPLVHGTWTRTKRNLTTQPAGKAASETVTDELITLTSRTLTLRRGEEIKVFSRP